MSYVGKILVVVLLALSLLFMSLAGAVFAIHANWKQKYTVAQETLKRQESELDTARKELETAKSAYDQNLAEQTQLAAQFQAEKTGLQAQVAALREDNNRLEQQRATQTGLAESKANEARFRQEEAEKQRIENEKVQARLDETAAELRATKDQLFTRDEAYRELNKRYEANLKKMAYLERVVAVNRLETDPEEVAKKDLPPPPVEGLVTRIRQNRAGRVGLVELSIGSDDGLLKTHELDVIRLRNVDEPQWLGRVRVVDLGPDWAVGEVVLPARNGIIQEGDNVTTKLK